MARRDKKAFLSDQHKEMEENNRVGKTGELFKKIRYQGNISWKDARVWAHRHHRGYLGH